MRAQLRPALHRPVPALKPTVETKVKKTKASQVLREALERVKDRREIFCCIAIFDAACWYAHKEFNAGLRPGMTFHEIRNQLAEEAMKSFRQLRPAHVTDEEMPWWDFDDRASRVVALTEAIRLAQREELLASKIGEAV